MIKIWPGVPPGSEELALTEEVIERSPYPERTNDRIIKNISEPSLIEFKPDNPNGTAVIAIPGGGYQYVTIDKEGTGLKEWLNSLGITLFVLKYRLPGEGHKNSHLVPLQDAQRAIRLIRYNADSYGINPDKIGVMGFSAGGHAASTLAVKYDYNTYKRIDNADDLSARPDFLVLLYPVITMQNPFTHKESRIKLLGHLATKDFINEFSNEKHITDKVCPVFLVHCKDDKSVPAENSLFFYMELKHFNINVELHIFYHGGHGFSLSKSRGLPVEKWPQLCTKWIESIRMI